MVRGAAQIISVDQDRFAPLLRVPVCGEALIDCEREMSRRVVEVKKLLN